MLPLLPLLLLLLLLRLVCPIFALLTIRPFCLVCFPTRAATKAQGP